MSQDGRSQLKGFLSSISGRSGDLSNITAPPYVLATKSAVEFPASWAEHPRILCAPAKEERPEERARLVLKWFLTSLRRQNYSGASVEEGVKKPLNAFLGELFIASYSDQEAGEVKVICEQVSHHPPVTACYLWNTQSGVRVEGYTAQSMSFVKASMAIQIGQIGHAIFYIDDRQEAYLVTLPSLSIKGILSGKALYPELVGENYITSSTGFTSKITYSGKGTFWGGSERNSFTATTYQTSNPSNVFFETSGTWSGSFTFYDVRGGSKKEVETFDTAKSQPSTLHINDLEQQDPYESRRAWAPVIEAIKANDWQRTDTEKRKIENAQRSHRGVREDEARRASVDGRQETEQDMWEPAMFTNYPQDPVFDALAEEMGYKEDSKQTQGVWKFDLQKTKDLKPPYHGDRRPSVAP